MKTVRGDVQFIPQVEAEEHEAKQSNYTIARSGSELLG